MRDITSLIKGFVPAVLKNRLKTSPLFVRHRSRMSNVYHCCVYRTGSQWIRRIFSDWRVCRYSGLLSEIYFHRVFGSPEHPDLTVKYDEFPYHRPFQEKRIVSLYAGYENFDLIPRPRNHRVFFVLRDPRDIVVSHYFSGQNDKQRFNIPLSDQLSFDEGLCRTIDGLEEMQIFFSLRSWINAPQQDERIILLRFEELTGPDKQQVFRKLFDHCDIAMPDEVLSNLLDDFSFKTLSGGRRTGLEDRTSHYRKGISGDWKSHFTREHINKFKSVTGDLIEQCGYEW